MSTPTNSARQQEMRCWRYATAAMTDRGADCFWDMLWVVCGGQMLRRCSVVVFMRSRCVCVCGPWGGNNRFNSGRLWVQARVPDIVMTNVLKTAQVWKLCMLPQSSDHSRSCSSSTLWRRWNVRNVWYVNGILRSCNSRTVKYTIYALIRPLDIILIHSKYAWVCKRVRQRMKDSCTRCTLVL